MDSSRCEKQIDTMFRSSLQSNGDGALDMGLTRLCWALRRRSQQATLHGDWRICRERQHRSSRTTRNA